MMSYIDFINLALAVSGLSIAALGLIMNLAAPYMSKKDQKFFAVIFSMMILYISSDLLEQLSFLFLGPDYALLSKAALFMESLLSSLLMPLLTLYLLYCSGENWRKSPIAVAVSALWLVYFILLSVTQFTTAIYYISPDNVYHRGPWYPLLLIPPALIMLSNLIALYRRRNVLSRRQRQAFAVYFIIPLICMLIQMMAYGILMIVLGTSAGAFFMFVFMRQDQVDRYIEQQNENARQRISIKILQMRPHFIYNTMMSIYYLIGEDKEKAQEVILDFTDYLRHNFTAISKEEMISFPEELEHARVYLAVEKARFEDKLFVEFDTPYTSFRIPSLTLQPVVENAVKYGVSPELKPLYITISTRDTGNGAEIRVEDTGPGYRPADDNEPHIALENIRERLKMMCGGTLEISQRDAGGTIVTISVPQQ